MARALILDDNTKKSLLSLKAHAEANPFSLDDMLDIKNGAEKPAGERPGFSIIIPIDYRVVFTIEYQPMGLSRHLSISVPHNNHLPHPHAIEMIMDELGFIKPIYEARCYIEDGVAINVIEAIK